MPTDEELWTARQSTIDYADDVKKTRKAVVDGEIDAFEKWQQDPGLPGDFGAMVKDELELWNKKGEEYTNGNPDRLYNFRVLSQLTGLPMKTIFLVYFAKHFLSVCNWVRTDNGGVEGIEGRLTDMSVYAKLGRLIAREG